jgi:hypothetical protein
MTTATTDYAATVVCDRGGWLVDVDGVGSGWAPSLPDVDVVARRVVVDATGADPAGVVLRVRFAGLGVITQLRMARVRRDQAAEALRLLMQDAAVWAVQDMGMSRRDAGALLGVSHQRVSQLLDAAAGVPAAGRRAS